MLGGALIWGVTMGTECGRSEKWEESIKYRKLYLALLQCCGPFSTVAELIKSIAHIKVCFLKNTLNN